MAGVRSAGLAQSGVGTNVPVGVGDRPVGVAWLIFVLGGWEVALGLEVAGCVTVVSWGTVAASDGARLLAVDWGLLEELQAANSSAANKLMPIRLSRFIFSEMLSSIQFTPNGEQIQYFHKHRWIPPFQL